MSVRFSKSVAAALLVAAVLLIPLAATQSPPSSLRIRFPDGLFFSGDDLVAQNATAGACGNPMIPGMQEPPDPSTFTYTVPFNGSYWTDVDNFDIDVAFGDPATGSYVSSGVEVSVVLTMGPARIGNATGTLTAAGAPTTLNFAIPNGPGENATSGDIVVTVTMRSTAPQGPGVNNIAIRCGENSKIRTFGIIRGVPGDGDIDEDGTPDSEETDRDNDTVPDAQEAAVDCPGYVFQDDPRLRPGDHDYDGDGHTDEAECAANTSPLDKLNAPPPPAQFPWGLLIFGVIAVAALAGLVFLFLVYGRSARITPLTMSELVVPKGGQGKYEFQVANLAKKGNPTNFQLSAVGMPEGWDARLQPDHAVLDPVGGAKNSELVLLTVASPERDDAESAVVKVKAIALNAAGRKDTLKLPANARTITSINIPPNAKVPVKRGAPVKMKTEKALAKEAAASAPEAAAAATTEEPKKAKKKGRAEPEAGAAEAPAAPTPAKPALQVGNLQHNPTAFKLGEDVKSTVTVTNNGGAAQKLKLSLFVNEALADAQTVEVKPGKSKDVKFKWTAQEKNKLNIRGELVGA